MNITVVYLSTPLQPTKTFSPKRFTSKSFASQPPKSFITQVYASKPITTQAISTQNPKP